MKHKNKHRFTYTLFDKNCKFQSGTLKASTMRLAKMILKSRYPKCTKVEVKSTSTMESLTKAFPSVVRTW